MYILSLEIIKSCNLDCSYCYLGEKEKAFMEWNTEKKAMEIGIHEAKKQYDKTLVLYFIGGEPLLAFERMKECVAYAEKRCREEKIRVEFSTTTNGTLLDEKIMDFLIEKGFSFKLSLDGAEAVHDKNRRFRHGVGSYPEVVKRLPLIQKYQNRTGKKAAVAQVVSRNTCGEFLKSMVHLQELGFTVIETSINSYEEWEEEELNILCREIRKGFDLYRRLKEAGSKAYWQFYESRLENLCTTKCFYNCGAGFAGIFVNVHGDIYPCTEVDQQVSIGNVENGLDVQKIRNFGKIKESENQKCLNCKEYLHCQAARCIMINYDLHRSYFIPSKVECQITKFIYKMFREELGQQRLAEIEAYYERRRA